MDGKARLQGAGWRTRVVSAGLFACVVLAVGLAQAFQPANAAPSAVDCSNVGISAPAAGDTLAGPVEIRGRALIQNFQFYKVEYSPLNREAWVLIGTDVSRTPVENGRLAAWQTTMVPDGMYRLRLHVVDPTGNYCQALVSPLTLANSAAAATETPVPTETEMLTVVPPQATPTVKPIITVEVAPVQNTPGAIPKRASPIEFPDVNIPGIAAFFLFGVMIMLAVLLFVGLFFFVKRYG